jgi:hypothetical protein
MVLIAGAVLYHNNSEKPERDAQLHRYNNGWVCVRCGHTWIPGEVTVQG